MCCVLDGDDSDGLILLREFRRSFVGNCVVGAVLLYDGWRN
jgi:hypothetical protein